MTDEEHVLCRCVGGRVQAERKRRKIRQHQLAEEIGLTRTSITNFESGRQQLGLLSLYEIAELFGCDIACLLPTSAELVTMLLNSSGENRAVD